MFSSQNLFETMLDFQRMEKLEFGGIKGGLYSNLVDKMHKEFTDHCQALKHSKNSPLDFSSQVKLPNCFCWDLHWIGHLLHHMQVYTGG